MFLIRIAAVLLSTMFISALCAAAQNTISLASNLTHQGRPAPTDCQEEAAVLARELTSFPRPDKWQWIILCDDAGWHRFLIHRDAMPQLTGKETIYGSTDLAAHMTFLRGSTLLNPDSPLAKADHVIAHELAHIVLNTADEERSEQQALLWLRERDERSGSAASGR
jgi:hypothetical protein